MESLFEVLYAYALKNRCDAYLAEDEEERQGIEEMVCRAMEELTAQGCGDLAQRFRDGLSSLHGLGQRSLFRSGLAIGLELGRL